MDTQQIEQILKDLPIFGGVLASDQLPSYDEQDLKKLYILNTDPSTKPGKHWVAIYINKTPEFFDSLGRKPSAYNKNFEYFLINHGPEYYHNCKRIQNYGTSLCGEYCVYYAVMRSSGYSFSDIVTRFGIDLMNNDDIVTRFRRHWG